MTFSIHLGFCYFGRWNRQLGTDPDKAIRDWNSLTTIHEVMSFHGLFIFYRSFGRVYIIMAAITSCLKKGVFIMFKFAAMGSKEIKEKLITILVFRHLDFSRAFRIVML